MTASKTASSNQSPSAPKDIIALRQADHQEVNQLSADYGALASMV